MGVSCLSLALRQLRGSAGMGGGDPEPPTWAGPVLPSSAPREVTGLRQDSAVAVSARPARGLAEPCVSLGSSQPVDLGP